MDSNQTISEHRTCSICALYLYERRKYQSTQQVTDTWIKNENDDLDVVILYSPQCEPSRSKHSLEEWRPTNQVREADIGSLNGNPIRHLGMAGSTMPIPTITGRKAGIHPEEVAGPLQGTHAIHSHTHTKASLGCPITPVWTLLTVDKETRVPRENSCTHETVLTAASPCRPSCIYEEKLIPHPPYPFSDLSLLESCSKKCCNACRSIMEVVSVMNFSNTFTTKIAAENNCSEKMWERTCIKLSQERLIMLACLKRQCSHAGNGHPP